MGGLHCITFNTGYVVHPSSKKHAHFCEHRCLTPTITRTFAYGGGGFITPVKHTCYEEAGVDRNHAPLQSTERQEETRLREV